MSRTLSRTLRFAAFTLTEYARSGRVLVELIASVVFFYIFLRRWTSAIQPDYFFSVVSLFTLALGFYTSTTVMALGDRPQGYLVLVRRLGRGGYLVGLYLAVLGTHIPLSMAIVPVLSATIPASSRSATRNARDRSRV